MSTTADGKPTKTNEQILAETDMVATLFANNPDPQVMMMALIYERLGDIWLWAKERR